jgi:hypothetical protein
VLVVGKAHPDVEWGHLAHVILKDYIWTCGGDGRRRRRIVLVWWVLLEGLWRHMTYR